MKCSRLSNFVSRSSSRLVHGVVDHGASPPSVSIVVVAAVVGPFAPGPSVSAVWLLLVVSWLRFSLTGHRNPMKNPWMAEISADELGGWRGSEMSSNCRSFLWARSARISYPTPSNTKTRSHSRAPGVGGGRAPGGRRGRAISYCQGTCKIRFWRPGRPFKKCIWTSTIRGLERYS